MDKSRLHIISGTQQFFLNNPFYSSNLERLLSLLNINKSTFHLNFRSKSELLVELLNYEADQILDKLETLFVNSTNPLASLNKFIDWRVNNFKKTGNLMNRLGSEITKNDLASRKQIKKIYGEYLGFLIQILEDSKRRGQLIASTPVKALANFILFGIEGGITPANLTNNYQQYVDHVEMIKRMVRTYRATDFN